VQLLPTPDANMGNGGRTRSSEALASGMHQANLDDAARLIGDRTGPRSDAGNTPSDGPHQPPLWPDPAPGNDSTPRSSNG
jgi:hypothetical protein